MVQNIISSKIEQAIVQGVFPGAVLLCAVDQQIVFHESFGMADIFEKRKMGKEFIFDLASLTKPFATTLALSRLMAGKQVSLNQRLGSIIEEFQDSDKAEITINMLLRHTSGFPAHREYFRDIIKRDREPRQYLRHLLVKEPLENIPGKNQVYSDLGYMVLSWVIEKICNQRLDRFVSQQIYSPLGINDLFFIDLSLKDSILKKYQQKIAATQQCPWRKKILAGEVDDDNAWSVGGVEGHAGLFGNADSVYKLCCEILNALQGRSAKVLSHDVIKTLVQKQNHCDMVAGFDTPSKENSSSGRYFSHSSIGHLGFTGTSFWIDPDTSLIVVFLTNRVHPFRYNNGIKEFRSKMHDLVYRKLISNFI